MLLADVLRMPNTAAATSPAVSILGVLRLRAGIAHLCRARTVRIAWPGTRYHLAKIHRAQEGMLFVDPFSGHIDHLSGVVSRHFRRN